MQNGAFGTFRRFPQYRGPIDRKGPGGMRTGCAARGRAPTRTGPHQADGAAAQQRDRMDVPSGTGERRVRVRVNFSGRRYVGIVAIPEGIHRVSDVLNDGTPFLYLDEAQTRDGSRNGGLSLNKGSITFIQALEEPAPASTAQRLKGDFVTVEVAMTTMDCMVRGRIFVPDAQSAAEVLNDERNFLSLRDAEVVGTGEKYPFLALCKAQVISVEFTEPVARPVGS